MNPYIFGINIIGECFEYMYMTTPISVFMSGLKKAENGTLAIQTLRATDLIHGMHTQVDFGSNMDGIRPCYISSHWCVK